MKKGDFSFTGVICETNGGLAYADIFSARFLSIPYKMCPFVVLYNGLSPTQFNCKVAVLICH